MLIASPYSMAQAGAHRSSPSDRRVLAGCVLAGLLLAGVGAGAQSPASRPDTRLVEAQRALTRGELARAFELGSAYVKAHPREAPGRVLPRPMSLCQAPPGELTFLLEAVGPGTRALAAVEPGEAIHVFGPLGNGYRLDVERPLLVGGGIGVAPFPYLSEQLGSPPALLGFRSDWHAEAAALVPNAEVVVEPTLVTELLRDSATDGSKVLACGPEPMLEAVRELVPDAQLAWEAPMACGYGACYGCSVEIDGVLQRLCVAGPVLEAA